MHGIDRDSSVQEIAALVSQALDRAGITATLSGGAAVILYSNNEHESCDLDFVTSARNSAIEEAIAPLGFRRVAGARQFEHPETDYYLEFPPGPLAFGDTVVSADDATIVQTDFGPVRIVTPTQIVMDRVAAYVHWNDNQSLDQAVMVARRQDVDWQALREWAERDRIDPGVIDKLRRRIRGD